MLLVNYPMTPARAGLVSNYLSTLPQATAAFNQAANPSGFAFGRTAMPPALLPAPTVAEQPAPDPVYGPPRFRRSTPDEAPMDAPSFSMDIADANPGTYGYSALSDATSQAAMDTYGVEDFGAIGGANQAEVNASLAGQAAAANYRAAQPSMPSMADITSQPAGRTVNQALDAFMTPTGMLGTMLGVATGMPGMGFALDKMAEVNLSNLAYDRAMEMQGVPGYSTGQIDGQAFSISPGPFGFGQVMSGVVPDYFDIDMAQSMQSVLNGIDPSSGTGIDSVAGPAGYNQLGQYVDEYGNISAYGTMGAAESLASKHGISLAQAQKALTIARSRKMPLARAIAEVDTRDYSYDGPDGGFDGEGGFGTGGVEQASYEDAVNTQAWDAFGAAFDAAAETASSDGAADGAAGHDTDPGDVF